MNSWIWKEKEYTWERRNSSNRCLRLLLSLSFTIKVGSRILEKRKQVSFCRLVYSNDLFDVKNSCTLAMLSAATKKKSLKISGKVSERWSRIVLKKVKLFKFQTLFKYISDFFHVNLLFDDVNANSNLNIYIKLKNY